VTNRLPFSGEGVAIGILAALSAKSALQGLRDACAKLIALGLNRIIWEKGLQLSTVSTYGANWDLSALYIFQGLVGLSLALFLLLRPDKKKASAAAEAPQS
jgi:hypothetical protein